MWDAEIVKAEEQGRIRPLNRGCRALSTARIYNAPNISLRTAFSDYLM